MHTFKTTTKHVTLPFGTVESHRILSLHPSPVWHPQYLTTVKGLCHFTAGQGESSVFWNYLLLSEPGMWYFHFWVRRPAKERHNWPAKWDNNTSWCHGLTGVSMELDIQTKYKKECARMSLLEFLVKPVNFYFTNPILTCKFIEVISNVISQVVVPRVLVVYELHITCVRDNSSNVRAQIKPSNSPNPLVSFEDFWGKQTTNPSYNPVVCTQTFQSKAVTSTIWDI